jgi:hypothetical protein
VNRIVKWALVGVVGLSSFVYAQDPADEAWKKEMERKVDILTRELEKSRLGEASEAVYEPTFGFGPSTAKVYHIKRGVSLAGYGEMLLQDPKGKRDDGAASGRKRQLDFVRAVIYTGYKFTDKILFNSELEFEHASTSGGAGARGEVSVEFAYLDFMLSKPLGVRAGMVLVPMGFINELHEPVTFHGARRSNVESNVIPTTWRENGAGVFGEAGPFSYRAYAVAGLQAVKDATPGVGGFSASSALRNGRSKGANSLAEDLALTGRVDYKGIPGALIGGSFYAGKAGQNEVSTITATAGDIDADVNLWEAHVSAEYRGLELRTLYAQGTIGDVTQINQKNGLTGTSSIGEKIFGGYVQVAFDILSLAGSKQYLAPFVRYDRYDTQQKVPTGFSKSAANSRTEYTYGLTYKPHPNTAIKADWQNMDNQAGTGVDQFNMAVAYMF